MIRLDPIANDPNIVNYVQPQAGITCHQQRVKPLPIWMQRR